MNTVIIYLLCIVSALGIPIACYSDMIFQTTNKQENDTMTRPDEISRARAIMKRAIHTARDIIGDISAQGEQTENLLDAITSKLNDALDLMRNITIED